MKMNMKKKGIAMLLTVALAAGMTAVSYTHLDVYKRQGKKYVRK